MTNGTLTSYQINMQSHNNGLEGVTSQPPNLEPHLQFGWNTLKKAICARHFIKLSISNEERY